MAAPNPFAKAAAAAPSGGVAPNPFATAAAANKPATAPNPFAKPVVPTAPPAASVGEDPKNPSASAPAPPAVNPFVTVPAAAPPAVAGSVAAAVVAPANAENAVASAAPAAPPATAPQPAENLPPALPGSTNAYVRWPQDMPSNLSAGARLARLTNIPWRVSVVDSTSGGGYRSRAELAGSGGASAAIGLANASPFLRDGSDMHRAVYDASGMPQGSPVPVNPSGWPSVTPAYTGEGGMYGVDGSGVGGERSSIHAYSRLGSLSEDASRPDIHSLLGAIHGQAPVTQQRSGRGGFGAARPVGVSVLPGRASSSAQQATGWSGTPGRGLPSAVTAKTFAATSTPRKVDFDGDGDSHSLLGMAASNSLPRGGQSQAFEAGSTHGSFRSTGGAGMGSSSLLGSRVEKRQFPNLTHGNDHFYATLLKQQQEADAAPTAAGSSTATAAGTGLTVRVGASGDSTMHPTSTGNVGVMPPRGISLRKASSSLLGAASERVASHETLSAGTGGGGDMDAHASGATTDSEYAGLAASILLAATGGADVFDADSRLGSLIARGALAPGMASSGRFRPQSSFSGSTLAATAPITSRLVHCLPHTYASEGGSNVAPAELVVRWPGLTTPLLLKVMVDPEGATCKDLVDAAAAELHLLAERDPDFLDMSRLSERASAQARLHEGGGRAQVPSLADALSTSYLRILHDGSIQPSSTPLSALGLTDQSNIYLVRLPQQAHRGGGGAAGYKRVRGGVSSGTPGAASASGSDASFMSPGAPSRASRRTALMQSGLRNTVTVSEEEVGMPVLTEGGATEGHTPSAGLDMSFLSPAAPESRLPTLGPLAALGYEMHPPISVLETLSERQLAAVSDFAVARPGHGMVYWSGAVDVRGLRLDRVLHIEDGNIVVYNASSRGESGAMVPPHVTEPLPPRGVGLNTPAILTLSNVFPAVDELSLSEVDWEEFEEVLNEHAAGIGAHLLSYSRENGQLELAVEHF